MSGVWKEKSRENPEYAAGFALSINAQYEIVNELLHDGSPLLLYVLSLVVAGDVLRSVS